MHVPLDILWNNQYNYIYAITLLSVFERLKIWNKATTTQALIRVQRRHYSESR